MTNFWDAVAQVPEQIPQALTYRAYFDPATGVIKAYSTEELDGPWIEITAEQYAESRYSMVVKHGVLIEPIPVARKLVPAQDATAFCSSSDDVSIIGADQHWKVKEYFNE